MKLAHLISVNIFLLLYLIKTILIFTNTELLKKISKIKIIRILEMLVSVIFLFTGIWMYVEIGSIKLLQIIKLGCVFAAIPIAIIGFKKLNKGLALLSLLLIITAYGLAEMSKKKPYLPIRSNNETTSTVPGADNYEKNCKMCHGTNGKEMKLGAFDITDSKLTDAQTVTVITQGRKSMPAYKDVLTTQEIIEVVAYVNTLKQ